MKLNEESRKIEQPVGLLCLIWYMILTKQCTCFHNKSGYSSKLLALDRYSLLSLSLCPCNFFTNSAYLVALYVLLSSACSERIFKRKYYRPLTLSSMRMYYIVCTIWMTQRFKNINNSNSTTGRNEFSIKWKSLSINRLHKLSQSCIFPKWMSWMFCRHFFLHGKGGAVQPEMIRHYLIGVTKFCGLKWLTYGLFDPNVGEKNCVLSCSSCHFRQF